MLPGKRKEENEGIEDRSVVEDESIQYGVNMMLLSLFFLVQAWAGAANFILPLRHTVLVGGRYDVDAVIIDDIENDRTTRTTMVIIRTLKVRVPSDFRYSVRSYRSMVRLPWEVLRSNLHFCGLEAVKTRTGASWSCL